MANNKGVPCIGMNNCKIPKRNSIGALMCMSSNNDKCLRKDGPVPK